MTREERDRVRLAFFREFSHLPEFSTVRLVRAAGGGWEILVGLVGEAELPRVYEGVRVRVESVPAQAGYALYYPW